MLIHPQFDPVAIHLGPLSVRWYGLMYLLAFVIVLVLGRYRIRTQPRLGWSKRDLDDILFLGVLGAVLGGRLGYVLFYKFSEYLYDPVRILFLWEGGMSFHGGFLGCVAAVILFCRKHQIPILSLGDITTAVGPIGLFLGRLANFVNSELWGRPADPGLPWAMIFPNGGPLPRHPSQLYEAGLEGIVLFTILAVMVRFGALKRPGLILGSFIGFYGLARITSEFFREPDPQLGFLWGGLTMGMLLSVPMVIAGAVVMVVAWRRKAPNYHANRAESTL